MASPLPILLFLILAALGWPLFHPSSAAPASMALYAGWLFVSMLVASGLRIAAQWEKALVFRLGKFRAVKGPGPFAVLPFFDSVRLVDTRIITLDIPRQEAITKDNVPATTMATSPGALQLRTLQTLDTLGNSSSNTVVLAIPVDVMTALQSVPKLVEAFAPESKPVSENAPAKALPDVPIDRVALEQRRQEEVPERKRLDAQG
ncbi:hypothetical protein EON82_05845 [bacterium]|nr:MAG: hypothetical protein EON82_05845 [bacterium]